MSEKLEIKTLPRKSKKLTVEKVAAVQKTAPMREKDNSKKGAPKKIDRDKQKIQKVIYLSESQEKIMEENAIAAGFKANDKSKWLKYVAVTPREETIMDGSSKEVAVLIEKIKSLQAQAKMKDEMIEILKKV